ncbi:MAG TPA: aldo/keto reductase [bacterium]|nr:aldo/keto reductase [bacterium]
MPRRPFGPTGVPVPVLGQGTWKMEYAPRARAVEALRRGLDLGLTHIDTAESYGRGAVEEVVGEAIEGRRAEVFLVSKVNPRNATRKGTITACERSLTRLHTDHLDCYLLHWPSSHPLADIVAAFEQLVADGKTQSWGVSNFDEKELEETVRLAGPGRVTCNQVLYHLGERAVEHFVLPSCARHGVALVAYSPFAQGRFRSHPVLEEVAWAHSATPRQVALAFLTRHAHVFTIPKASRVAHVEDNAGAGGVRLTDEEIARIDAAFPVGPAQPGDVPVL